MTDNINKSVTYIFRNGKSGYSINKVFKPLLENKSDKRISVCYAPCYKADIVSMIRNLIFVYKHRDRKGINHMTGGPHYFLISIPHCHNVLTIHDLVLLGNTKNVIKRTIFKYLWFKIPLACSDAVTCISEKVRREVLDEFKINPQKVFTVYNPVDTIFSYVPYNFNKQNPRILQIGTGWNKNLGRVIDALNGITCKLIIIGDISMDIITKLKCNEIDYENYCNISDKDIFNEYRKCDIVSFPSLYEGFGMPIIEGQTVGRPVLTSDLNPMKEISKGIACMVDPFDVNSIREGFLRLINDEKYRTNLITIGVENAKRFDKNIIAEQYEKIYNSIL
jgi:glycosyltransferase involved in cell wall biosynthesis